MTTCCLGSVPKNKGIISKYSNMKSNWNDNQTEKRLALTCFNISISTCPFDMKAGLHRDIPNPIFFTHPYHPNMAYATTSKRNVSYCIFHAFQESMGGFPIQNSIKQDLPIFTQVEPSHFLAFLRGNLQPNTIHVLKISILCQATTKTPQFPWKFPFFFKPSWLHGHLIPPATTWRQFIERLFGARLGGWNAVDSKDEVEAFSKKQLDGLNKLWGFFRFFLFGFFLERPFDENIFPAWSTYNCQSSLKCASTGLNDAVHRWRPMVTGMVVTQQRCCDQSPCHPATMVGILEKIHPLPWRYVSTRRASFVIKARQKGTIALTVIHVQLSKGLSEEF